MNSLKGSLKNGVKMDSIKNEEQTNADRLLKDYERYYIELGGKTIEAGIQAFLTSPAFDREEIEIAGGRMFYPRRLHALLSQMEENAREVNKIMRSLKK